jgi:hypothetical protein
VAASSDRATGAAPLGHAHSAAPSCKPSSKINKNAPQCGPLRGLRRGSSSERTAELFEFCVASTFCQVDMRTNVRTCSPRSDSFGPRHRAAPAWLSLRGRATPNSILNAALAGGCFIEVGIRGFVCACVFSRLKLRSRVLVCTLRVPRVTCPSVHALGARVSLCARIRYRRFALARLTSSGLRQGGSDPARLTSSRAACCGPWPF